MSDIAQIWKKEMEECVMGIERLIVAAAERAADLERDPLLNGRRQSVAGLRNHLRKLAEDAEALRREFRPGPAADVEESMDSELLEHVTAERNGASAAVEANGSPEESGILR